MSEKYCKFAYSSEFGFSVPRSNKFFNQSGADSTLSFEIDGYIFTRRLSLKISVKENSLFSLWSPFKGIKVETTLIPIEGGHIRRHKVTSDYDCIARDAGFSVHALTVQNVHHLKATGLLQLKTTSLSALLKAQRVVLPKWYRSTRIQALYIKKRLHRLSHTR